VYVGNEVSLTAEEEPAGMVAGVKSRDDLNREAYYINHLEAMRLSSSSSFSRAHRPTLLARAMEHHPVFHFSGFFKLGVRTSSVNREIPMQFNSMYGPAECTSPNENKIELTVYTLMAQLIL
jgi:hypothetical protein